MIFLRLNRWLVKCFDSMIISHPQDLNFLTTSCCLKAMTPVIWNVSKTLITDSSSALLIECFHMTSRQPYLKRRPYWCPKPVLWELNSFLMQTLSFVPINLHRCWPREWKHSFVDRLLNKLKKSKGAGLHKISSRLIQGCAALISQYISINYFQLPDEWTLTKVTPIFKQDDRSDGIIIA